MVSFCRENMGLVSPGSGLTLPWPKVGQPVIASRKLIPSISVASGRPVPVPALMEDVSVFMLGDLGTPTVVGLGFPGVDNFKTLNSQAGDRSRPNLALKS